MGLIKKIDRLFDALDNSELPDRAELRCEAVSCINALTDYFSIVVKEQLFYSSAPEAKRDAFVMKRMDEERRSKHDCCIRACSLLNGMCEALNIDKICCVDTEDRAQIAGFCGYLVESMYFGNIRCDEDLMAWLDSCPLNKTE